MVAVSFLWLLALPHRSYSKVTYISENALQPGAANVQFDWNDFVVAEAYRQTVNIISELPPLERAEALRREFAQVGLKSATQNYTLHTSTVTRHGVNTYAIFYAPRSDGTEALILSAPWKSRNPKFTANTNGVAMLLALAKVFKRGSHFSKDIIFVISDGDTEGLQAWLKAYHGNEERTKTRFEETLHIRSGAIQAALNLDFAGTGDYNVLGIFFEGVNGQLPNLDMINTVVEIARGKAPVEITLHDDIMPYTESMPRNYTNSLNKMFYMMKYQAAGTPTGNHGVYLKYKIDAITLYGFDKPGWPSPRYNLFRLGAVVESTVRSLNNLLEHLHQSFFFYLLSGVRRYTSIGLYMPPIIILGVSFILQALSLWGISSDLPLELKVLSEAKATAIVLPYSRRSRNLRVATTVVNLSFITGYGTFYLLTTNLGFPGETPLIKLIASVGICSTLVFSAVSTAHIRHRVLKERQIKANSADKTPEKNIAELIPAADWIILKTFILALSALFVTTLSALNFSLAVFIGTTIVLPYKFFRPCSKRFLSAVQAAVLVMISPPGLLFATAWWFSKDVGLILSWAIEGYEVLGTWLLPTLCCIYWPINLAAIVMVLLPVS
ncbi:Glycosyl phosphatidyl inositol protein transamidase complex subunit [Lobosporangium transversale]|nr:Glycosyl phosphatidyl inositol protein transamidase complex subunit [Lobosporangium transversale]